MQFISSGGLQEYKLPVNAAPTVPTMELDNSSQLAIPEYMAESITAAYQAIFGEPIMESILMETQREIDEMTRRTVYSTIVTNILGREPEDWNDPQVRELYQRVHDDHARPVSEFLGMLRDSPVGSNLELPDFDENTFTNRRGHELTLMQSILNNIRQTFFNFADANRYYMPGATRIALLRPGLGGCGFGTPECDPGEVKLLKTFIKYVCEVCPDPEADDAQFDVNLNGMTLRDIRDRFGNALNGDIISRRDAVRAHVPGTSRGNYRIVHIPDYASAQGYRRYFPVSPWCITESQMMWDSYTLEGQNTVYFCLRDGFENIPPEPGEDVPLDNYGTSMIAVIVDRDGDLATATPRWNDANGSSDYLLTEEDVADLIGQPFYDAFPPVETEEPEYVRRARAGMGGMPPMDGMPPRGMPPMGGMPPRGMPPVGGMPPMGGRGFGGNGMNR